MVANFRLLFVFVDAMMVLWLVSASTIDVPDGWWPEPFLHWWKIYRFCCVITLAKSHSNISAQRQYCPAIFIHRVREPNAVYICKILAALENIVVLQCKHLKHFNIESIRGKKNKRLQSDRIFEKDICECVFQVSNTQKNGYSIDWKFFWMENRFCVVGRAAICLRRLSFFPLRSLRPNILVDYEDFDQIEMVECAKWMHLICVWKRFESNPCCIDYNRWNVKRFRV